MRSNPHPESSGGGGVTNQDIRVDPHRPEDDADEIVDVGRRREAQIAGGNGEQRSRKHARLESERRARARIGASIDEERRDTLEEVRRVQGEEGVAVVVPPKERGRHATETKEHERGSTEKIETNR